jgi:hypothetical protein
VPSMEALLDSDLRPKYWRHWSAPQSYNPVAMGWKFDVLASGQDAETDPEDRRLIYDTTLRGYGNQGHSYSDDLSEEALRALLEYLKKI